MGSPDIDQSEFPECKIVKSPKEVDELDSKMLSRSQLFFSNVQYEQRGKYICVATQTFGKIEKSSSDRAVSYYSHGQSRANISARCELLFLESIYLES